MKFEQPESISLPEKNELLEKFTTIATDEAESGVIINDQIVGLDVKLSKRIEQEIEKGLTDWLVRMGEQPIKDFEYLGAGMFRVPISPQFIDDLESFNAAGYGLKGGAARELLYVLLGRIEPHEMAPRDIDIIRIVQDVDSADMTDQDRDIAQKYAPEDYENGYGVDFVHDVKDSINEADFTMNMLAYKDGYLYVSGKCLRDTVRGFVRLTDYAVRSISNSRSMKQKLMMKAIRLFFITEQDWGRSSYGKKENDVITGQEFRAQGVSNFLMALQIDRAYEKDEKLGAAVVDKFCSLGWLDRKTTIKETILALNDRVKHFGFRHVPIELYQRELKWLEQDEYRQYEDLPKYASMKKSK